MLGGNLLDHIIVGGDNQEYLRFRQKGIMRYREIRLQTDFRSLEINTVLDMEQAAADKEERSICGRGSPWRERVLFGEELEKPK